MRGKPFNLRKTVALTSLLVFLCMGSFLTGNILLHYTSVNIILPWVLLFICIITLPFMLYYVWKMDRWMNKKWRNFMCSCVTGRRDITMPGKPFMQCSNSKKDCFANKDGACRALSSTIFKYQDGTRKECPFYKSRKQHQEERKKYEV